PVTGGWRLKLRVKAPESPGFVDKLRRRAGIGRQNGRGRVLARLVRGENLPRPLTETFVHDFPDD
ncbi:MAG: hypothetical protein LBF41_03305, partial [Deltaproteobacteria bacterium]|nr:hypothetical protein [Deltaproteobacteria bacterium]